MIIQKYKLKNNLEFKIVNYSNYFYFPPEHLREGLREIIIFTENNKKYEIPNGAVYVYDKNTEYKSEILKAEPGCGITSFFMESVDFDDYFQNEVLKAVDSLGIHIGQGNHFIDFTTGHPLLNYFDEEVKVSDYYISSFNNMVFFHSHFNEEKRVPKTLEEAIALEEEAKYKRIDYLDKLLNLLGVKHAFYKDWTHNSVRIERDHIIYRKGAINLKETDFVGLLALNPYDGLYLYSARFDEFYNSMQHGTGRKNSYSKGFALNKLKPKYKGIAIGFSFNELKKLKNVFGEVYNPIDSFLNYFWDKHSSIGYVTPHFIVFTKKKNAKTIGSKYYLIKDKRISNTSLFMNKKLFKLKPISRKV